mmetsp:Transcript_15880/g.31855  ORF Transcript_15880/g.31855 Transcript_15880/m.31855 type:complete len:84 (-) Transcript_15880:325-576(-)
MRFSIWQGLCPIDYEGSDLGEWPPWHHVSETLFYKDQVGLKTKKRANRTYCRGPRRLSGTFRSLSDLFTVYGTSIRELHMFSV